MNGPWTVLSSEQKFKTKWLDVREDAVLQPDGKPGTYGVVTMSPGVSVLPLDGDDNVHLNFEFKYAIGREILEAPTGGLDGEEEPIAAAKRELAEEAGLEADTWTDLGPLDPFTSSINAPKHLFLARDLRTVEKHIEATEVITPKMMPFSEAFELVMSGEITHAATCVLILKTAILVKYAKPL